MPSSRDLFYSAQSHAVQSAAPRSSLGFFHVLWIVFLILQPVYVFSSGLPQPADGLMVIMLLILATGYVVRVPIYTTLYFVAGLFLADVAIVNWFTWSSYSDKKLLYSSLYYLYNFSIFALVLSLLKTYGNDFVKVTRFALVLSVVIEFAACVALAGGGIRQVGTFNNPNQLGYWSLLTLACWLVLKRNERLAVGDFILMAAVGYMVTLSLSRAALMAFVGLVIFALIGQRVTQRLAWSLGLAGSLVAIFLILQPAVIEGFFSTDTTATSLASRLEATGTRSQDSLGGRGYDRIWLYPEYLFFGAGEGAYERFVNSKLQAEIHSTFGTVLFSYGFIGISLFCLLLYHVFRKAPISHLGYFLSICLYGLTHQGLRTTGFWIFLALVFGLATIQVPAREGLALTYVRQRRNDRQQPALRFRRPPA